MKARRKGEKKELRQEQIGFFNRVLLSASQEILHSDALCALVKYN